MLGNIGMGRALVDCVLFMASDVAILLQILDERVNTDDELAVIVGALSARALRSWSRLTIKYWGPQNHSHR